MNSAAVLGTRDLTQELRARLIALESEEEAALAALARIKEKKEATARLLELEDGEKAQFRPKPKRLREVHEIVREKLLAGMTNKDEIIEAVEAEGHEKPGRSVNASLMTFKRYGHVEQDDREFVVTLKGKDALSREAGGRLM
jgi:hypothetical protein